MCSVRVAFKIVDKVCPDECVTIDVIICDSFVKWANWNPTIYEKLFRKNKNKILLLFYVYSFIIM